MKKKKILSFLLVCALSIGMAVSATAAPEWGGTGTGTKCSICGKNIIYAGTITSEIADYKTAYNVPDIQGISTYEERAFFSSGTQYNYIYAVKYNNEKICLECLETKINEYKAANGIPTVGGTTAVDTTTGAADVPITVTRDAPTFSVTVPTAMPISVGADGKVTTARNVAIENNSSRSVCVKSVTINAASGWTLAKFDKAAMRNEAIDAKKLGFSMTMGTQTAATTTTGKTETIGSYTASDVTIDTGSQLPITYDGTIPAQVNGIAADTQAASVIFTVDWAA